MKLRQVTNFLITMAIMAAAVFLSRALWIRYMDSPWTRDGRVRADVVNVAADVSGIVVNVAVKDNQLVRKGERLFTVDQERYRLALEKAQATVAARKAEMVMRQEEYQRRAPLENVVVSTEIRDNARTQAESAAAAYQEAMVAVDTARLNLRRTEVCAPVDGYITNLNVHPGDFATAGDAKLAVIDKDSFWVYGYFEETRLHLLHRGDQVEIRLLGYEPVVKGHIESMARGISDRDNPTSKELLSDVNPVFNWVRLAQRVPVRIRMDSIPQDAQLAAGMTCTVIVQPPAGAKRPAFAQAPSGLLATARALFQSAKDGTHVF
ncbi:MAG TPA: HlyD family secretion protein [Geomonas sp.]|nr:HlyD family secretion protein [Geomonas sp.]